MNETYLEDKNKNSEKNPKSEIKKVLMKVNPKIKKAQGNPSHKTKGLDNIRKKTYLNRKKKITVRVDNGIVPENNDNGSVI